jgi:hypothetical protein
MGKVTERRFNKEKLLFLVALAALAGASFFLLETRPATLAEADPVTRTSPPPSYQPRPAATLPSEPAKARRTPFMPDDTCGGGAGEGGGMGKGTKVTGGANGRHGGRVTKREPPRPLRDPDLGLEYVGIVSACGQTCGLLRGPKGVQLRVQAGDVLETWGCSVAAIADQSIVLRAKNGRIYELRSAFTEKLAATEAPSRDSRRQ